MQEELKMAIVDCYQNDCTVPEISKEFGLPEYDVIEIIEATIKITKMEELKFTNGPWKWTIMDSSCAVLHQASKDFETGAIMDVSPCSNCISKSTKWEWGRCTTPELADAQLIAAAPELYEALEDAICKLQISAPITASDTIKQGIAALKKAKGE